MVWESWRACSGKRMRTRFGGSSWTGCAETSSWILRIAVSTVQYLRRFLAHVLAMATVVVVDLALWYCRRADVGTGRICALSVVTSKRGVTGASESWCIIPGPGFAHLAPSPSPSSSPHPSYDQRFLLVSTKRLHIFHGVVAITPLARASRCRRITFYFSEHHGNDAVTSRHSPIS